jgi:hypothetical protein
LNFSKKKLYLFQSANGIFVDNKKITGVTELFFKSQIGIGCQVEDSTLNDPDLFIFTLEKKKELKKEGESYLLDDSDDEDDDIERRALLTFKKEENQSYEEVEESSHNANVHASTIRLERGCLERVSVDTVFKQPERVPYEEVEEISHSANVHASTSRLQRGCLERASVDTVFFKYPERVPDGRITTQFSDSDSDDEDMWFQQSQIHHQIKREEDEVLHANLPDEIYTDPYTINLDSDGELDDVDSYHHLRSIESQSEMRVRPIKFEVKEEPDMSEGESENEAFIEEDMPSDRMIGIPVWRSPKDTPPPMELEQTQSVENHLKEMMKSDDDDEDKYEIEENNSIENIAAVETQYLQDFMTNNTVYQQQETYLSPPVSSPPNSPKVLPPVLTTPSPIKSNRASPPQLESSVPSPPTLELPTQIKKKEMARLVSEKVNALCDPDVGEYHEKDKREEDKQEKHTKGKHKIEKKKLESDRKAAKIPERRKSNPEKVLKRRLSSIHFNDSGTEVEAPNIIKKIRIRKVSSSDDDNDDFVSKPDPVPKPSEPTVVSTTKAPVIRKKPEVIEAPYMPKRRGRAKSK